MSNKYPVQSNFSKQNSCTRFYKGRSPISRYQVDTDVRPTIAVSQTESFAFFILHKAAGEQSLVFLD